MDKYQSRFTGVEIDARLAKVNQEFTPEEKDKLSGLVNYDDTEVWKALRTRVEKVEGKGLSSNDFTDDDKSKLNGLYNYDDTTITQAVEELQASKANASDVYTKLETDSAITAKVSEIVAGAPEDFNTLKEMSDWLTEHEDSAASMNTAIQKNAADIANRYTKTESDKKYLGKTETAAAAVLDSAGGNIAKQFADITVKNSSGWIYAGSSQQGWHKAAECAYAEASSGRRIASFYISGTTIGVGGILNVNVMSASNSTLSVRTLTAHWVYRSSSINPENFVLVAKLEEGKIIAELWVKLTSTYQAYNFIRVRSVKLTTEIYDDTAWKACNSSTASESYPTDYELTYVSVDNSAAKYDASGNDISATYLTHGVGTLIPSNSDLNDSAYIVAGVYRAGSNAIAASLLNCPTKMGFRMEVKATIGIDRLVRFIYPNASTGVFYMQNYTADGFGSWYKFTGEEVTTTTTSE